MTELLDKYGVLLVFLTVLVEQLGLPLPAYPVLIVAGALGMSGQVSWALALLVAVLACLISDYFWFRAGRFYGKRILRLLCRISLNPDYCVSQTEDNFVRYGEKSLLVAKFIPGFNTIAPPLAGAMGTPTPRFVAYTVAGGLIWSATGLGIGAYFSSGVDEVLGMLATMGSTAGVAIAAALGLFMLFKFFERWRFQRNTEIERITMPDLAALMKAGHKPVIVDARSNTARELEAAIPGALIFNDCEPAELMAAIDKDRHVIVYCSCPNDVTAATVARQFLANGFHRARPLKGGLDAWNEHKIDRSAV
jgi:membrane protein DedA with SNARE-associated domain/rhodanese-related sulfurtransferase